MSAAENTTAEVVALIGAGVMGSAVLDAMLAQRVSESDARITTLDEAAQQRWRERGVAVFEDNAQAVSGADVVVVAVKPADVPGVLDEVRDEVSDGAVVVSLAAGVRLETLEAHLNPGTAVVRVMPNTPALVGQGMSALSPGTHCDDQQVRLARELLETCGQVVVVPEKQQDAVTAVSGSGPAYVFAMAEAMVEGGVLVGLPRNVATQLVAQTLLGAATMLRDSDTPAAVLRERVTSPGGTTAVGLRQLDRGGFKAAVLSAVEGARDRSVELGG